MIISIDGWTMSNIANTIVNSQPRISLKQYVRNPYQYYKSREKSISCTVTRVR